MQKVCFSIPPELVEQLDRERGDLSRNRFVLGLLQRALQRRKERMLHRITAEVYGDVAFAEEEEDLTEDFFRSARDGDL